MSEEAAVQPREGIEQFGYQQELRRGVSPIDLVCYGLIFMVPIAPFAIFGQVFSVSGGMPVLAYLIGMVALLFTTSSYAQMVRAFPLAGSVYSYTGRGIAPPVGFLTGWAILLDYVLAPGLLYLVAAVAMHSTVSAVPVWAWLIIFVVVNTAVNLRGITMTVSFTKLMLVAELLILALFLVVGVWALAHGKGRPFSFSPLVNSDISWPIVFGAVSVAVLSFLGFDGISMLVEESRGGAAQVGRALRWALMLAGLLFIVQVWVAALLVPDPQGLIGSGDPGGTAFYDAARVAGGSWLSHTTSTATAISWGVADTLVAQVAISRLLYAMARDRQLPAILARVSAKRGVPGNAILLAAGLSTALGLWMSHRSDGITLLSSLINMGALIAFVLLHVAVVVHHLIRKRSRNLWSHLVVPLLGAAILIYVVVNANIMAQRVGLAWLGLGVLVLAGLYAARRRPQLAGLESAEETA